MSNKKILILASTGYTTDLLFNALKKEYNTHVIIEKSESKFQILSRRIKRIGFIKTIGQVAFIGLIQPVLSKKRIFKIIQEHQFDFKNIDLENITSIESVNNPNLIELIDEYAPDLIVVNGTRIISNEILDKLTCPIVNIHVGITPKYRGVHGGYWALYNQDSALFGVTLHYVNQGIDTGQIIAQKVVQPDQKDNFNSYPILQYAAGINLLLNHCDDLLNRNEIEQLPHLTSESKLHYHPGFFQYLTKRFAKGVK